MAIYHCSIKIISRGKGRSAVAAAAYRAGEKITNDYDGILHDYTRKSGVVHTEILLPGNAPDAYADRAALWNAVEKIEKNKNSQLAREFELALPVELSAEQNLSLVREYVNRNFVAVGMCADVCIHDKNDGNPHAHIMLTTRSFQQDGIWAAKSRKEYILDDNGDKILLKSGEFKSRKLDMVDWNDQAKAEIWRSGWADAVNTTLEQHGVEERVNHRSYERQGVEQIPTVHMGAAASQMEQRGIATQRGDLNREIHEKNNLLKQIWERIKELRSFLKEVLSPPAPPMLAELLQGVLVSGNQHDRYGRTRNLKPVEQALDFLHEHDIATLPQLRETVTDIRQIFNTARDNLNRTAGQIDALDMHIKQGKTYLAYLGLYKEYQQLKPKKQQKFFESHRAELTLFEAAARHFKEYNIGADFSIPAWKARRSELSVINNEQYRKYKTLNQRHHSADMVLITAERVVRESKRTINQLQRKKPQRALER